MILSQWAARWGVSPEAMLDLQREFGMLGTEASSVARGGDSEAAVSKRVQLEASRVGARLWRNNVGAVYDAHGNFFRYGLANSSAAVNKRIKSSDLIGIRPDGTFLAREVKRPGWKYTGKDREPAQLRFIQLVTGLGGDAAFATEEGTL